jgi:manganese/zinc/iron transport system ATP- binding protein
VDAATEQAIVAVLRGLAAKGRHVVAVHHDLGTVPEYFSAVLLLNARVFAAGPVQEAFTNRNIAATYGARLAVLDEASVGAGAVGA